MGEIVHDLSGLHPVPKIILSCCIGTEGGYWNGENLRGSSSVKVCESTRPCIYDAGARGHNIVSWSPYGGSTFVRGESVFADGEVLAAPDTGRFFAPLTWTGAA